MLSNKRFLIVEDDALNIRVLDTLLKHHHAETIIAKTAEDALDILKTESFDCLLIDLDLPKMDGWELLDVVRKTPKTANAQCIAITAYHDTRVEREAHEAGFNGYFSKPLHTATFANDLIRMMSQSKP